MSDLRYVVTIAFCTEVMHNAIQFVLSSCALHLAWNLYVCLYLHDVVYLGEIHVTLAKNEAFQMYHEYLW